MTEPTIEDQIADLRDNHMATMQKAITSLQTQMAVVCAKVKILLWLNVGIAAAVLAGVILGRV